MNHKLDFENVEKSLKYELAEGNKEHVIKCMEQLQTAIYVMCGGGFLGSFAAEQPFGFYIDSRVGRLPYPKRDIEQAAKVLQIYCKVLGFKELGANYKKFHNCGVW